MRIIKTELNKLSTLFCFFLTGVLMGQPSIEWSKTYGGSNTDVAISIQQAIDGGYIVAGFTDSNDGDVTDNNGFVDSWILKLDESGNLLWQKTFGGSNIDFAHSVLQTTGGDIVVGGMTSSDDGDVTENQGGYDFWILKLDGTGNLIWQESYGGSGVEYLREIKHTLDGGYIISGDSSSNDGDITENKGGYDYLLVKLDESGNLLWQRTFGGSDVDQAYSVQETMNGNYIVAGTTNSSDGDVTDNKGGFDCWILKLASTGNLLWQKTFGGSGDDQAYSVQQTMDGEYIVAGSTNSSDGDVTTNHGLDDFWIFKLDNSGNLIWEETWGGIDNDEARSIYQTIDGRYVIAGSTRSDESIPEHNGATDFAVVMLDNEGSLVWQSILGGTGHDRAFSVQQTIEEGYIIAGSTVSNDGDVEGNHGLSDFWVVKLEAESMNLSEVVLSNTVTIFPNPSNEYLVIDNTIIGSELKIVDIFGRSVLHSVLQNERNILNTSNFLSGVYLIIIENKGSLFSKKLIIER